MSQEFSVTPLNIRSRAPENSCLSKSTAEFNISLADKKRSTTEFENSSLTESKKVVSANFLKLPSFGGKKRAPSSNISMNEIEPVKMELRIKDTGSIQDLQSQRSYQS